MSEQLSLIQLSNCTLTETSAVFTQQLDYKQWIEAGRKLCKAGACLNWWLGDWLLFGVKEYGDRVKVAESMSEEIGFSYDQLRAAMLVSDSVKDAIRIATLSWSHHREVAAMKPKQQSEWLAKATVHGWSVSELRQAIRQQGAHDTEAGITTKATLDEAILATTRWLTSHPIEDMDEGQRQKVKERLRPIVEVYEQL